MNNIPQSTGTTGTIGSSGTIDINTSNYTNQAVGSSVNLISSNMLPYMFGDSQAGNMISGLLGSTLSGAAKGFMQNGTNGALQGGLKSGGSSLAGIGAGMIGNGIESLGGHSKTSKFLGGAASSGLGTIGSNFAQNGFKGALMSGINPWGFGMSVVGAGLTAMNGPSKEYGGTYGGITKTMDTVYDAATGIVSGINPVVGGAMVLNKGLSNLFGSTDGMTVQDAILGSSFMPAPVKWLNMAGAKKTGTFNDYSWQNMEKASGVLGSYGNLESKFEKAMKEAGKTYGTFSRGARKKAQRNLDYANNAWGKIQDIADEAELGEIKSAKMLSVNSGRYAQDIQGGLNQYYRGKYGMKIPKAQYGRILDIRKAVQQNKKTRNLADLITYSLLQNPRFIQRLEEPELRYIVNDDGSFSSHRLSYRTDDRGRAIVYPTVMEDENGNLKAYDDEDAYNIAMERGDILDLSDPKEAELFTRKYKTYKPWNDKIKAVSEVLYPPLTRQVTYEHSPYSPDQEDEDEVQAFYDRYKNGGRISNKPYFNMETGTIGYAGDDIWNSYLDLYNQKFESLKKGGTLKKKIKLVGKDFEEGEYIEVDSLDSDQKAGRKPIGKDKRGRDIFLNGDGNGVLNQNGKQVAFKEGGTINSGDYDFMTGSQSFKKGGSMNVIPEGALHARKHHMTDSEKLTQKGIPVVDNDGNQQAEIECNEIIFRKEVTDKIEQLRKKFKEASNSEKDDIAIQCGKILTKEIINNTEDRTGLLKIVEDGMGR